MKNPTNDALKIAKHIHSFLSEYAPTHKTSSNHTIKSYRTALELYLIYLEEERHITPITLNASCFDAQVIESWLRWMKNVRKNSNATCNVRLGALRTFLMYLSRQDVQYLHLATAASNIERLKQEKRRVSGISREAVKALLNAPNQSCRTGIRDITFMVILYGTACRLDEILSLTVKNVHIDCEKPFITVIGKGQKIRTLYLLPKTVAHLKKYIKEFHGASPHQEAYLFYSRNKGLYGKLSETAAEKLIRKNAAIAHETCPEVPLNLHPHQLRHSKSTHWLEDGMNIVQISSLLGHEQLATTMIYVETTALQHTEALATIETEAEKRITPKWKSDIGSLKSFCGLKAPLI